MSRRDGSSLEGSVISSEEGDHYETFAKYYDLWTEDLIDDIEFFKRMAERCGGPILECMCGTGRILIPLAKDGYEIWGIDRSQAMLDKLMTKVELLDDTVQERVHVHHADIIDFQCPRSYKLIFVPFNSFMHLLEREEQETALINIASHLDDDGLFILSVFNPRLDRPEELMRHRGTKIALNGEIVSRFESQVFDQPHQRTTIYYFIDISRQDRELRRVTTTFTLRYLFYQEAIDLIERCGMEVVESYGDHNFSPFKRTSDLMVFVAKRSL